MKLHGITILSCEMFAAQWNKADFRMVEIWKNVENGTLEGFEKDIISANSSISAGTIAQTRCDLAREIIACCRRLRDGEAPADFLQEGKLNAELLQENMKHFLGENLGEGGKNFLERNDETLQELYGLCGENWNDKQANTLYLFLLLSLQIIPRNTIRPQDVTFLKTRLNQATDSQDVYRDIAKLCLTEDRILRCTGNEIQSYDLRTRTGWSRFFRHTEPIGSFAFTETLGLIAFTKSGKLCSGAYTRLDSMQIKKPIQMAAAYGTQYILLAEDGTVISSMPVCDSSEWKDLTWVSVGLNSAAGIRGDDDLAVAYGPEWNAEYKDVKTVFTHCARGIRGFAILHHDGVLCCDVGENIADVETVCVGTQGYLYIKDGAVYVRPFGGGADRLAAELPDDVETKEFYSVDDIFVCGTPEKTYLGILS